MNTEANEQNNVTTALKVEPTNKVETENARLPLQIDMHQIAEAIDVLVFAVDAKDDPERDSILIAAIKQLQKQVPNYVPIVEDGLPRIVTLVENGVNTTE